MHLPHIRTGISVKAGSRFDYKYCAVCKFPLQTPFIFLLAAKKKQHFPSHCVFGAPRMRFGAVKPPSCALPCLALVTYFSFVLARPFLPPASPCGE
ncbi:hypothetical protein TNCV_1831541 [Trichonephila clavipes]|nr:hypothetical protein TNCV_1831541 [Trichonephila clavipes]